MEKDQLTQVAHLRGVGIRLEKSLGASGVLSLLLGADLAAAAAGLGPSWPANLSRSYPAVSASQPQPSLPLLQAVLGASGLTSFPGLSS